MIDYIIGLPYLDHLKDLRVDRRSVTRSHIGIGDSMAEMLVKKVFKKLVK